MEEKGNMEFYGKWTWFAHYDYGDGKYVHTEVENIDNTQKPTKYIHNGQLYIQKGEHTYTVMGNKVQ